MPTPIRVSTVTPKPFIPFQRHTYIVIHARGCTFNHGLHGRIAIQVPIRSCLTPLEHHHHVTHDLKLVPVDLFPVLQKRPIAFLRRYKVPAVQWQERYPLGGCVVPRQPVFAMTLVRAHQKLQAHEVLVYFWPHELACLAQSMYSRSIDTGDNSPQ